MSRLGKGTDLSASLPDPSRVRELIAAAIHRRNFLTSVEFSLRWVYLKHEQVHWEIFRGRALDQTQTRATRVFESWCVFESSQSAADAEEPLLAIRYDERSGEIHVTRSIRCRVWEGDAQGQTILAREAVRRVRELVGTIQLRRDSTEADLADELSTLLFHAVVGTSRLPLTSLEAPIPEFTFGQLAYSFAWKGPDAGTLRHCIDSVQRVSEGMSRTVVARLLEFSIRAAAMSEMPVLAAEWKKRWDGLNRRNAEMFEVFREMFNQVALTPWTDFAPKTFALVDELVRVGQFVRDDEIDLHCHLLRQIGRHLTSFDLVQFHHRGANYPDALLLEVILARLWPLVESHPAQFQNQDGDSPLDQKRKRLRRRGIRSAWLLMEQYRGLLVPDAPTSPGENARILPDTHPPVPDRQILNVADRQKRLFANVDSINRLSPSILGVLRESVFDLRDGRELEELGIGLFLDRPLGFAKAVAEPDQTILLSHEAFSAKIASSRAELLRRIDANLAIPTPTALPTGVRWTSRQPRPRPGVASIQDAMTSADDFAFLRTTRRSVEAFLGQYSFDEVMPSALLDVLRRGRCLIIPAQDAASRIEVFDEYSRLRLRLEIDVSAGYLRRLGNEFVAAGLVLCREGDAAGLSEPFRILPRI